MGMGMGQGVNSGRTTYWHPDPIVRLNMGYDVAGRSGLGGRTSNRPPQNNSMVNQLVQQAMAAQANPVSMAQLFPYMNYGDNMGGLLGMTGQYGAGRFLGGNAMGNTGMTSNAMNTM
jgi:hypothetical protein